MNDQNQQSVTLVTTTPLFRASLETGEVGAAQNQQSVPHVYRENTGRKDQGWALLDEGSAPPVPGEDGPAITDGPTITDATTLAADENGRTYKTQSK
jgi:hypothetical protein